MIFFSGGMKCIFAADREVFAKQQAFYIAWECPSFRNLWIFINLFGSPKIY